MKVIDEDLLDEFRAGGACEWCHCVFPRLRPHHLYARGMGGGGRLDLRLNLVALCDHCHAATHDGGRPRRAELLEHVACRHNLTVAEVLQVLDLFRRHKE